MAKELEAFIMLFNQLKSKVNDSPTTLAWLSDQKPSVRRLAYLVGESVEKIRKDRAKSTEKHSVVPPGFITAWKEYENHYASHIIQIVEAERKTGSDDFLRKVQEIAESRNEDPGSLLEKMLSELELRREPGDSFDPAADDPAALIEDIFLTYKDVVDVGILSDEAAEKAIGAWHFFEKTLGLNHHAIYNRWKMVPELLIPSHALSVNPQPIYKLYNEAVRSYVFGNKIAAISMCRALLEHILEKHYKIEEDGLDKMITIVEGRYKHFEKMKMHEKRKLSNKIMHEYEKKPKVKDQAVIDFLIIIRTIVQHIPK